MNISSAAKPLQNRGVEWRSGSAAGVALRGLRLALPREASTYATAPASQRFCQLRLRPRVRAAERIVQLPPQARLLQNISCIDLKEEKTQPTSDSGSCQQVEEGRNLKESTGPREGVGAPGLHYGKFLISKLKKTQGLTLANTLRRILLYEVPAIGIAAITSINFQSESTSRGVATLGEANAYAQAKQTRGEAYAQAPQSVATPEQIHEFSRIPGLYESLLELTMNLESVVFKGELRAAPQSAATLWPGVALQGPAEGRSPRAGFASALAVGGGVTAPPQALPMSALPQALPRHPQLRVATLRNATDTGLPQEDHSSARPESSYGLLSLSHPGRSAGFAERSAGFASSQTLAELPHIVRAKDLILPNGLTVVYPDQYIATIAPVALQSEAQALPLGELIVTYSLESYNDMSTPPKGSVEVGGDVAGAKPFPQASPANKKSAPIKKVNYTIENYRDGGSGAQNEQIIFEIWTNGSISPQDAMAYGVQYAVKLFQQFLPD